MYSPLCNISSIVWTGRDVAVRVTKISQNVMSIRMPRATVGRHLGISIFYSSPCFQISDITISRTEYFCSLLTSYSSFWDSLSTHMDGGQNFSDHLLDTTLVLWFKQVASQTGACAVHYDTTATPSPSRATWPLYHG